MNTDMRPSREDLKGMTNRQKLRLAQAYAVTEELQEDPGSLPATYEPIMQVRDEGALNALHGDVSASEQAARQLARVYFGMKQVNQAIILIEAQMTLADKVKGLSEEVSVCMNQDHMAVQGLLAQAIGILNVKTNTEIPATHTPQALYKRHYALSKTYGEVSSRVDTDRFIIFSPRDLSERIDNLRTDIAYYAVQKMDMVISGAEFELEKAYHLKNALVQGWVENTAMLESNFENDVHSLQHKLAETLEDLVILEDFIDHAIPAKNDEAPRVGTNVAQYKPVSIAPLANL